MRTATAWVNKQAPPYWHFLTFSLSFDGTHKLWGVKKVVVSNFECAVLIIVLVLMVIFSFLIANDKHAYLWIGLPSNLRFRQ